MEMTSFAPEKFLVGGGQIGVDERSKNFDFECIMKAFLLNAIMQIRKVMTTN